MTSDHPARLKDPFRLTCQVQVSPSDGERAESCAAIIDTGSDASSIPLRMIQAFNLVPVSMQETLFADGRVTEEPLYALSITLPGWPPVPTVARGAALNHALVGMDGLRLGFLTADGPRARFRVLWSETWRARLLRALPL
jgi:predicted aspartyl protease